MKTTIPAAVAAGLFCAGLPAFADGPDDLWEITMKMEMAGMPSMPERTSKVCQRKGNPDPSKMSDKDSDCQTTDKKQTGNKASWKFSCTKPQPMTGSGEVTYGDGSYQGIMKMKSDKMDVTQTFSGKKVGTCAYEDPMKKVEQMQAQNKAMMAKECDKQIEQLNPMMVFGGHDLPESALLCKDRKADFCAQTGKVTQSMKDPAGYAGATKKYPGWREAMKACGSDPATVSGPVCKVAVDKKDWPFVGENCPDEGRAVALQNCTGMDYTAMMSSPYREVCQKYGADLAKKKVADDKAAQPAAAPKSDKDKAVDAVKDGANKLKSLLKF
ncbi:MAG TPA: DUF3617 family protein [Burkholderiales bacterium]|nr:DUF3617 family protein [Burkholderiales bacterium]